MRIISEADARPLVSMQNAIDAVEQCLNGECQHAYAAGLIGEMHFRGGQGEAVGELLGMGSVVNY